MVHWFCFLREIVLSHNCKRCVEKLIDKLNNFLYFQGRGRFIVGTNVNRYDAPVFLYRY